MIVAVNSYDESHFEEHFGLVRLIVKKMWRNPHVRLLGDRDDVLQTGKIGLLEAIRGYDERCGFAFTTHARVVIRRFIRNAARSLKSTVPLEAEPMTEPLPEPEFPRYQLDRILSHLTARQSKVLRLRYFGKKKRTLEKVGRLMKISLQRVSKIETEAKLRFRTLVEANAEFSGLVDVWNKERGK